MDVFKQKIVEAIKKETGLEQINLEIPPNQELGDYAFPCFELAKKWKKNHAEIAQILKDKIKLAGVKTEIKGAYLNFFIDYKKKNEYLLREVLKKRNKYGSSTKKNQNVMIEFFHANTHKAVHIGHIRNICLGESIARILEFSGYDVIRVNYQGDIGPHVAKCMWGILNLKLKMPEKNKLRWLGGIYAKANEKSNENAGAEEEIRVMTKQLYEGDKKLTALWIRTRKWCLDDFNKLYKEFNVKFNRLYFESEVEKSGKEISRKLVDEGITKVSDEAIIADLEQYGLGILVLVRNDEVALYGAKDLGLSQLKLKEYRKIDKSLHVVGKEQEFYFKQLFKIFELMKSPLSCRSYHIIYELVMLPEGKMSSREGNLVLYYDLIDRLLDVTRKEVEKRNKNMPKNKLEKIANQIAFGALKFSMANRENNRVLIFDMKKALDLEGETGPYIQYANTRINSILKRYGKNVSGNVNLSLLTHENETQLINILQKFPNTIEECAVHYKTNLLARYLLDLSQALNRFYHSCPILQEKEELKLARLVLIKTVQTVISQGLYLLGIETPERM